MSPTRAQAHDQHRRDEQESHQDPQEIRRVARREWIQFDAAEDVGQRNQENRTIDGRHEDADGRVRQGDPFVVH
jgi:hypothetical protein